MIFVRALVVSECVEFWVVAYVESESCRGDGYQEERRAQQALEEVHGGRSVTILSLTRMVSSLWFC
jgi:hypothetical protein